MRAESFMLLALTILFIALVAASSTRPLPEASAPVIPSAQLLVQSFFDAIDAKDLAQLSELMSDSSFELTISDYSCHIGYNKSVALGYLNTSFDWYSLMQRSLEGVVQVGDRFAANFVDAGFIPAAKQAGWRFLSNSILDGVVTNDGKFSSLHFQMNFSSTFGDVAEELVRAFDDSLCNAVNASQVGELFVPTATIQLNQNVNGGAARIQEVLPLAQWLDGIQLFITKRDHCALLQQRVVPGCGFASVSYTLMHDSSNATNLVIEHGFARFDFAESASHASGWAISKLAIISNVAQK